MSLSSLVRQAQAQKACSKVLTTSFTTKLSEEDVSKLNIKFVGMSKTGEYLYTNEDDDHSSDIDDAIVRFCQNMFDWESLKQQFSSRGINVTGPDKSVVMARALKAYKDHLKTPDSVRAKTISKEVYSTV